MKYRLGSLVLHNKLLIKFLSLLSILSFFGIFFTACSFHNNTAAPVTDLRNEQAEKQGYHVVARGENFYFIAWRYNKDFQELAAINNLHEPYNLKVGQKIYLRGKAKYYSYRQVKTSNQKSLLQATVLPATGAIVRHWLMPARGQIIAKFSLTNKGIDIAGQLGEPVVATAPGEVVYAGAGLRGYGNLLILKHNDIYLSAYAHNRELLVKEGQMVKAGQQIATMGSSDADRVMLHFELRQRGKPVNPLSYIK